MGLYDKKYKQFFSDPYMLTSFLKEFVKERWVSHLDFSSLELVNKSFVSKDNLEFHDDLIWKVKLKEQNRHLYIYLLMEFQSYKEYFMALRMANYTILFYLDLLTSQNFKAKELLPPVMPIVIYRGKETWDVPLNLKDLIAMPFKELSRYMPAMEYFVLDEARVPDVDLEEIESAIKGLVKLEKSQTPFEGFKALAEVIKLLKKLDSTSGLIKMFYEYFISSQKDVKLLSEAELEKLEKLTIEEALQMWPESLREYKNNLEKAALERGILIGEEKGIEKGRFEGEQIGIAKGEQIGIEKGKMETAENMLRHGLSAEDTAGFTGLSVSQVVQIKETLEQNN